MTASPFSRPLSVLLTCLTLLALFTAPGCSSSTTPAASTASAATALPPLQGSYRAPTGDIFSVSGPGTFRSTGASGTFTVLGDRVDLVREDGQPIKATRPDADRLVLYSPDGKKTLTFYRAGSAAAQSPEALARPSAGPAQPDVPKPDPNVPLDRYTPITDAEMLRGVTVAFSQDPFGEKAIAALLPQSPSTDDAFARRERVAREGAPVIERLKRYRENRYYRLSASNVPVDMPRTPADFQRKPRFVWEPSSGVRLNPYDFERKGFPMACLAQGRVTVYPMPVLSFVVGTPQSERCFLPVPDEAVARRIEAKRANGADFAVQAELYWHAGEPKGPVLQANLTHVELTLLSSERLDGTNVLGTFPVPL